MSKNSYKFVFACTVGDPSSIGPEIAVVALTRFLSNHSDVQIRLFAPQKTILKLAPPRFKKWVSQEKIVFCNSLDTENFKPGKPSLESSRRALSDLARATDDVLSHHSQILVTGPVDKSRVNKVDSTFRGHTEYLRDRADVTHTTMLLSARDIKVAPVTTHVAVKDVSSQLSISKIEAVAVHVHEHLKRSISKPKIAVCALNPHAGDGGLFGNEEAEIIAPAVHALKKLGLSIEGPFPADGLFHKACEWDAIICMYHDQGLIPLKMLHFYDAVNVTLGLPFLRVSVDHGTTFDLAGKGKANPSSYVEALNYAYHYSKGRSSHTRPGRSRT